MLNVALQNGAASSGTTKSPRDISRDISFNMLANSSPLVSTSLQASSVNPHFWKQLGIASSMAESHALVSVQWL